MLITGLNVLIVKLNFKKRSEISNKSFDDSYGKVSREEYQAIVDEIKKPRNLEDTLREDYEQGIWDGKYFVDFSCNCQTCGWSYHFKYEDKNPLENKQ